MSVSIDLAKQNFINLKKTANEVIVEKGLDDVVAQVELLLDASGSMSGRYRNGTVQRVVERLLAVASKFDIDKKIGVNLFDTGAYEAGEVGEDDFYGYVDKKILTKYSINGGTNYAPAMNLVADKVLSGKKKQGLFKSLFGKKETENESPKIPTYALFVTDGENFDQLEAETTIKKLSDKPIFWVFVGIGNERFTFLRNLDDMKGRFIDNADFFQVNDIDHISDKELYNRMLNEFPRWINEAKSKGIIQ